MAHFGCTRGDQKMRIVIAQPLKKTGAERDVSNCGWPDCIKPQNSATESIPAALRPLRATVGSNTETDDDWRPSTFHREAFGV